MLTVARIDRYDMVNNPGDDGPCMVIWFCGCTLGCEECHNPKLQIFDIGFEYGAHELYTYIDRECRMKRIKTVVFMGGEPLDQYSPDLVYLTSCLNLDHYNVWLYTGYELHEISPNLLKYIDTIKCGRYDKSLRQEGKTLASSNQRFYRKINGEWKQIEL